MAEDSLRRLAVSQRRRLVATILGYAEREIYPDLTEAQRTEFRQKVLEAVSAYHDLMLDILGTAQESELINVEAIELLKEIREKVNVSG